MVGFVGAPISRSHPNPKCTVRNSAGGTTEILVVRAPLLNTPWSPAPAPLCTLRGVVRDVALDQVTLAPHIPARKTSPCRRPTPSGWTRRRPASWRSAGPLCCCWACRRAPPWASTSRQGRGRRGRAGRGLGGGNRRAASDGWAPYTLLSRLPSAQYAQPPPPQTSTEGAGPPQPWPVTRPPARPTRSPLLPLLSLFLAFSLLTTADSQGPSADLFGGPPVQGGEDAAAGAARPVLQRRQRAGRLWGHHLLLPIPEKRSGGRWGWDGRGWGGRIAPG